MSWASYPVIPPGKIEIGHIAVICQGKRASWGNQSLGCPPQILQVFSPPCQDNTLVSDGTCDLQASVLFISHL